MLTNPRTLQQGESNPIDFDQSGGVAQLGAMMNAGRLRGMLDMSAQDGMTPGYNAMLTAGGPDGFSTSYRRSNEIGGHGDAQNAIMIAKQFGERNAPSPSLSAGANWSGTGGPITYDLSGSVPLTTGRNPEAPQFRLPSSREEQPMVPLTRRDRERQPSRQEVKGAITAGLSHSPRDHSTRANAGLKFNYADGGHVDAALHLLRQHFDEGGFLDSLRGLFSGDDYQSTGDKVVKDGEVQWGDPESAADFFRADKARMALDQRPAVGRPEDDVTGSVPLPRPRPAPEAPAVSIPFEAPKAGVGLPEQAQPDGGAAFPYTGFRAVPPGFSMPSPVAPDLPAPRAAPDVRPMAYAPATGAAQAPALQAINAAASPLDIRDISHLSQYRGSAMENPQAVVFHHTAGEGTPEGVVDTLNTRKDPFTGRPMTLGAHYIIDRDGSIHSALPPGTRGAHIMPSKINDLSNYNTYGVEVIAKDNNDITPEQIAAGQRLYTHLSAGRSEPLGIFGHGELNPGHKLPDEGLAIVNPIRTAAAPVSATDAAVDTARKVTNRAVNYPELSTDDKDLIAKTIAAEASGKSPEEAHAIANVILNRAIAGGRYGKSIRDILFAENQFEPWSDENNANYPMKFKPGMKAYDAGAAALQRAYDAGDITGGSTYFWAPKAQGELGRNVPGFAKKYPGFNIGATRFHRETREDGGEVDGYAGGGDVVKQALNAIRGWHGSGKQFKQFDASKMGSGVGELFGRGVYITDAPDFARTYRDMGVRAKPDQKIGNAPASELYSFLEKQAESLPPEQAQQVYNRMRVLEDLMFKGDALAIRDVAKTGAYDPEAMSWFEGQVVPKLKTPGGLYEVEIKAKPEQFLQWQKPFGEQSPFIQDALRPNAVEMADKANQARAQMLERGIDYRRRPFTPERIEELRKISTPEEIGGLNLYGGIHRDYGSVNPHEWQPEANQFLRDKGVVGNAYKDKAGQGDIQNYVVYDPADTEILNRYSHGGDVEAALHAVRNNFDNGGKTSHRSMRETIAQMDPERDQAKITRGAMQYSPEELARMDEIRRMYPDEPMMSQGYPSTRQELGQWVAGGNSRPDDFRSRLAENLFGTSGFARDGWGFGLADFAPGVGGYLQSSDISHSLQSAGEGGDPVDAAIDVGVPAAMMLAPKALGSAYRGAKYLGEKLIEHPKPAAVAATGMATSLIPEGGEATEGGDMREHFEKGGLSAALKLARRATSKGSAETPIFPQVAERYPAMVPPVPAIDKKTGKEFLAKTLSPEAVAVQKARIAAQKEINAGNYQPYFPIEQRFDVDPSNYPEINPNTSDLIRMKLPKAVAGYEAKARDPQALENLRTGFEHGLKQKDMAENWYYMGQLEAEFIKEYGPEMGRTLFKQRFPDAMAATTGGADPTSNLMMAHFGNYLHNLGEKMPTKAYEYPFPVAGGKYGIQGNMDQYRKMIMEGEGLTPENPKRYNFSANFLGKKTPTIDEQMSGAWDAKMASPPTGSYGHYEGALTDLSNSMGYDPRYFQEVGWAGIKDMKTPGGFKAQPMIGIVNEAIERTHQITGMPRDEIVRRGLVRAEIPLYGAAGATAAGAMGPEFMQGQGEAPAPEAAEAPMTEERKRGGSIVDRALMLVSR
jgi:hypothetical protein